MEDFKRGFVVQSLESNFLRNNALRAFLSLLQIVGNIEYLLFVTFLNSMACYDSKVRQLQSEIGKLFSLRVNERTFEIKGGGKVERNARDDLCLEIK